ncbi:PEPxxWA-CTERM sorting domain-containing protein [Sphingomonas sp. RS2018]
MKNSNVYIASALLLASVAAPANAVVFNMSRSVGKASVTGTITTDDTTGVLQTSNITAFDLTLVDAQGTRTITSTGDSPFISIFGSALTATTSGLFFNLSATGNNGFLLVNQGPQAFYCIQTGACFDFDGAGEGVSTNYSRANITVARQTGIVQIASAATGAVPEPATWAMMLVGFGGIGFAMRRQTVTTRIRFA